MKQITQIIDVLSGENCRLEDALVKAKVFLHRLGERNALEWIDRELEGYDNDDDVPEYRIIYSEPRVTATDGRSQRWHDVHAVTVHLKDKEKAFLTRISMRQSISEIEYLAQGEGDAIGMSIPPEFLPKLSSGFSDGIHVERANRVLTRAQMLQILTVIRSRLLDFFLTLEENIPTDVDSNTEKNISTRVGVESLFNNAIFGDNTTVVIGGSHFQIVTNAIQKNDIENLIRLLTDKGMSRDDTDKLRLAIENDGDNIDRENKRPGANVTTWTKNMLKKAVDGTWKISLSVAGDLIEKSIQRYFGF